MHVQMSMVPRDALGGNFVVLLPAGSPHADNSRRRGLKGEAKVLGAVQILSGIMLVSLGLLLACTAFPHHFSPLVVTLLKSGYPSVGAKWFVLSGLLSIVVGKTAHRRLAWASLATNLLSLVTAFGGLICLTVGMTQVLAARRHCELDPVPTRPPGGSSYGDDYSSQGVIWRCALVSSSLLGVLSVMLLFTAVEFCVAIPTSVLSWRQARLDVPGNVRFLAQSDAMAANVPPKVFADTDPTCDEPVTSKERGREGDVARE